MTTRYFISCTSERCLTKRSDIRRSRQASSSSSRLVRTCPRVAPDSAASAASNSWRRIRALAAGHCPSFARRRAHPSWGIRRQFNFRVRMFIQQVLTVQWLACGRLAPTRARTHARTRALRRAWSLLDGQFATGDVAAFIIFCRRCDQLREVHAQNSLRLCCDTC